MGVTSDSTDLSTGDRVPYVHQALLRAYCEGRTLSRSELPPTSSGRHLHAEPN